jgi:hypothetical protein
MPTAVSETAPDWSALVGDVPCPLCDYNLRGLSEPRCPECGYTFAWPDLFDPARRRHPYLFEHHPERNVRSFVRTWLHNLWSPRFWQSLSPVQQSRPVRLVTYWVIATLLASLVFAIVPGAIVVNAIIGQFQARAVLRGHLQDPNAPDYLKQRVRAAGSIEQDIEAHIPWPLTRQYVRRTLGPYSLPGHLLAALTTYVAWPWLTFAILMIFQGSMRRAKVKPDHVLRCALYSCDAALVVGLLLLVAIPWADPHVWRLLRYLQVPGSRTLVQLAISTLILIWTTPRLASAYARYLRFDHPFATALSSQIIVLLLVEMTAGVWGVN